MISPCRCEKKYHKNCILLNLLYSNSLFCEDCFELYNIKYSEKYNYFNLFFSPKYLLNFLISILMIILLSIAIYIVSENKELIPEKYNEMKIFFILLFLILNIIFISSAVINCFGMRRNTPPIDIYVEDIDKISYEEEFSNRNNIISDNQNSNQNLFTNNVNNLSSLNKINKKNSDKKNNRKNGLRTNRNNQYESTKNYVDYHEFFLNIFHIEIFESKMNIIKRKKLLADKKIEHINTIKELNDDEFQQNILIKFMDFESSKSSIDEESFKCRKKLFIQQIKKNSTNNIPNSIKKKQSEKKTVRKISIDTPIWQDSDNDTENDFNFKKLNGINQDILKKNIKGYKKVKTIRRESSEINNLNTENFNTNINSASGEKFKFSNKDLTGLNVSNIQQDYHDNLANNNDKLILKENTFNHINKKPSNNILRYNTLSKFTRNSNKDLTSNNLNGNIKLNKMDNEGIDYHNFIVSEEREMGVNHHFKAIPPRSRQSEDKVRIKRKDSKIPSAIFGENHDFKFRNSTNSASLNHNNNRQQTISQILSPNNSDHNQSNHQKDNIIYNNNINFNSLSNQYDFNNQNTKTHKRIKVVRRYTSYNPQLMKNLSTNSTSKNNINYKKVIQSIGENVGMNIFSTNVMNDYSLENSYNLVANKIDFKSPTKKNLNDIGIQKRKRKNSLIDCGYNSTIMNKNSNIKFNFGVFEENEINNINQINSSVSSTKKLEKIILSTMSPSKPKRKLTIGSDNKNHQNKYKICSLNHSENELFCDRNEDFYRKNLSYSHIGLSLRLRNKLSHDLSNSCESNSHEKINQLKECKNNNLTHINKSSIKNNYGVNNFIQLNQTSKNTEEINYRRKSSYLKETQLNTINEDTEIQFKSINKKNYAISENYSELNDECYEKNITIYSDDVYKLIELPKDNSLNLNNGKDIKIFDTINSMINNGNDINNRNNIKLIKNHLMDNIDNIIKEDKSDSYIESSEFSEDSVYKSQYVAISKDDIKNRDQLQEKINFIKKRKENADKIIRKFNSAAPEKKTMGDFFMNEDKKNLQINKVDFRKSNSNEFPKIVNNFKLNNEYEESKMIDFNNEDENLRPENFNNKSKNMVKNKNSYTTNFILSSNFDSLVISESNDEIKNSYVAFNKRSSYVNALSEFKNSNNESLYDVDNNQIKKKNELDDKGYKINLDSKKHEDITFNNNNIDKIDELLDMENLIMSKSSEDVSEPENQKIS